MKIEIIEENIGEHNEEKEDTGTEVKSFYFYWKQKLECNH